MNIEFYDSEFEIQFLSNYLELNLKHLYIKSKNLFKKKETYTHVK